MPKRKRKSRAIMCSIDLPSNGINYEQCGDHEQESHVDYVTGSDGKDEYNKGELQFELQWPLCIRLDASKLNDILWDATDNSLVLKAMYEAHTEAVDYCASEDLGFELKLKHEIGDTAWIPLSVVRRLFALCRRRDKFEGFKTLFEDECSCWPRRTGEDLLAAEETAGDWDSQALGILLRSALRCGVQIPIRGLSEFELQMRKAAKLPTMQWIATRGDREFDGAVQEYMCSDETEYNAWSNAVDWKKYEAKVTEARREMFEELFDHEIEELSAKDREFLVALGWIPFDGQRMRCPLTMELPPPVGVESSTLSHIV
jgi:hypothetical protein